MKSTIKNLVICGAGGLGREILSLIRRDYDDVWNVIGFIDPNLKLQSLVNGVPVLPESFLDREEMAVVLGMASSERKTMLLEQIHTKHNLIMPNIISSKASVDNNVYWGIGNVVTDFCWISTNVKIGNGVFVNVASTIGHDAVIEDCCSIMPQCAISGNVYIGKNTLIGAKSFILQGKHVGQNAVIAAGSCVFRNVDDYETVWGNPAHTLVKDNRK